MTVQSTEKSGAQFLCNRLVYFIKKILNNLRQNITKGILCDPGDNVNNYIQANNGIHFGNNIELGPGVAIISSNHDSKDFSNHEKGNPIKIGNRTFF